MNLEVVSKCIAATAHRRDLKAGRRDRLWTIRHSFVRVSDTSHGRLGHVCAGR